MGRVHSLLDPHLPSCVQHDFSLKVVKWNLISWQRSPEFGGVLPADYSSKLIFTFLSYLPFSRHFRRECEAVPADQYRCLIGGSLLQRGYLFRRSRTRNCENSGNVCYHQKFVFFQYLEINCAYRLSSPPHGNYTCSVIRTCRKNLFWSMLGLAPSIQMFILFTRVFNNFEVSVKLVEEMKTSWSP